MTTTGCVLFITLILWMFVDDVWLKPRRNRLKLERMGMSKQFNLLSKFPGDIVRTVASKRRTITKHKSHLAKMATGEYALVESWEARIGRVYLIVNQIGSHPTEEDAVARFKRWLGTGE